MMAKRSITGLISSLLFAITLSTGCRANELAAGPKSSVEDELDVTINKLENFNYLTQEQILGLRAFHVMKYPQLLGKSYKPNNVVFGQIIDNKPWWGMRGAFLFGSGDRSIEGDSEESRFLVNPYLLVAPSPWSAEIWDLDKLPEEELNKADFPYCWFPCSLKYQPKNLTVSAFYEVSDFDRSIDKLNQFLTAKDKSSLPIRTFGLVCYNARDFGYNYIYVPIDQSKNIKNPNDPRSPIAIEHFIHSGNSCGYPGGCNNMSPAMPAIDNFQVTNLPATVKVLLWKQKPHSAQSPPDMTVFIELK